MRRAQHVYAGLTGYFAYYKSNTEALDFTALRGKAQCDRLNSGPSVLCSRVPGTGADEVWLYMTLWLAAAPTAGQGAR